MPRFLPLALAALSCGSPPPPQPAPRAPTPTRVEHQVYSLIDNRLMAHVERDGALVLLPGAPAFAKYLAFEAESTAWTLHREQDGHPVGLATSTAAVELPLSAAQAATQSVTLRTFAAKPLQLTINDSAPTPIAIGWQTTTIKVATLTAGENRLRLSFAGPPLAVEWIAIGGTPNQTPAPFDPAERAFRLQKGDRLTWYLYVPKDAELVGAVNDGCALTVTPGNATLSGTDARVDLAAAAGQIVRLELSNTTCPNATFAHAAITVGGTAKQTKRGLVPTNVILWVMDSLRADRIRAFDPTARPETPAFTALAARGTRFTHAYVQGNESRVSHATIWTSLYPVRHGMTREGAHLDPDFVTLGEAMHDSGRFTAGFTANGYISGFWGFADGWDVFHNAIHEDTSVHGADIVAGGLALITPHRSDPFMLYLGTVDTHVSWRAKEPWLSRYDPGYKGRFAAVAGGAEVDRMSVGQNLATTPRERQHMIALYDSNVSYQDALLGQLSARLDAWGADGDTLLIVTADHGDELWEDGRVGHGGSLRETLIHVPLLIVYPPLFPPGGVVDEPVEAVDLLPTILEALDRPLPAQAQGISIINLAQGAGAGYPRPAFSSQFEEAHSLRLAGWKIVAPAGGAPVVYDLTADPGERHDLTASRPLEARFLCDSLATFLAYQSRWKKTRWGFASNASPFLADDLER